MKLISVECKTPFFAGGRRLHDNVFASRDDIPGSMIRASLARMILRNCPLYHPQSTDPHGRHNWVYIRDVEKCSSCQLYDACKSFSDWHFGFLKPKGVEPVIPEDKICKMNRDHGFHSNNEDSCNYCGGRLENTTGWKKDRKLIKVNKITTTKTAIDRFTRTAQIGSLYTVESIYSPDLTWEFEWDGTPEIYFQVGDLLELGKYTSSGYGQFTVTGVDDAEPARCILDLPIKLFLMSEAIITPEHMDNQPASDDKYLCRWKKALFPNLKALKLTNVQAELDIYRGYDTTKGWGKAFKEPCLIVGKGAIFEFKLDGSDDEAGKELANLIRNGIGLETNNGFGKLKQIIRKID